MVCEKNVIKMKKKKKVVKMSRHSPKMITFISVPLSLVIFQYH